MRYVIAQAIYWFANILTFLMVVRAVFSWLRVNPYSTIGRIRQFCVRVTDPIVAPCRSLLRRFNTGMFDFSVWLALILVQIIANILVRIIL